MAEVIGVRFKENGKSYYFDPKGDKFKVGDLVVVDTARGIELGEVANGNQTVSDDEVIHPLREVVRRATDADVKHREENKQKEKKAFAVCEEKIAARELDMKLVDVEYAFDDTKILFYFTADGRVDFRELVKDLASVFHTRIELRQIGVRDEAKMLGGLGICGRPFCCNRFLNDFLPVS
ncbi:MAG: stage 0 sporulation protein, partial [Clostridia bacterium]|nr:stage 0 sporulation protein [Clostridia bacterium]